MSKRWARVRPRTRTAVIGSAAIVAAALVVGIVIHLSGPERVSPADMPKTPEPTPVAATSPVVPAPANANLKFVTNATGDFAESFAGDLVDVRSRVQGKQKPAPATVADPCLLNWAKANLAQLAPTGTYAVMTVCDRPTAVLAGPAGADDKVLVYAALEPTAPTGMKQALAESTSDRMAFVAVRSSDGKAQLMAAAALPNASQP